MPDLVRFACSLTGNRDLAEDIAQESMARALQASEGLGGITNLRAWLWQIAVNVFREWWRKHARELENLHQFAATVPQRSEALPDGTVEQRERLEQIWAFIYSLPEIQRQVIQLNIVERCSHAEIARKLNISSDSVKSNLCLVRRKLRDKFLQD